MTRNPILLALDTATQTCSAAVLDETHEFLEAGALGSGHSESILPLCDRVLSRAGIRLQDCDAVAFGAGPGAFTGLRVACGVAQGLAWGADKPVVAAGNLEALAFLMGGELPRGTRVLACLDARMHQAYCAAYELAGENARPRELMAPRLANPGDMALIAREVSAQAAAGSAIAAFPEALEGTGLRLFPEAAVNALHLARLARLLWLEGCAVPASQAAPLYVRNRVALTIEQRLAGEKL